MTIEACLEYLLPGAWQTPPVWPPDAFAVCAYILQKSGAYTTVATSWPPPSPAGSKWTKWMRETGVKWRDQCVATNSVPPEVQAWWNTLLGGKAVLLREMGTPSSRPVVEALLQLSAAADEACEGIGMPGERTDLFDKKVAELFRTNALDPVSTVCSPAISKDKVCVLPKSHTPQSGITIRSLTHNLALCQAGEVTVEWWQGAHSLHTDLGTDLNLLIVPWPLTVAPHHFSPAPDCSAHDMPENYGFFDYNIRGGKSWPATDFEKLLGAARELVDNIDGVVLPEVALRPGDVQTVWDRINTDSPNTFLIAGVGGPTGSDFAENRVSCILPLGKGRATELRQDKHHRWLVEEGQIRNYGLFKQLDVKRLWWENTQLNPRRLRFLSLTPQLSLCCLICEDLARQDPIADLIRSVGPNLVVALLMDGPQLKSRWPARYATVLADDPGSSVLTLTSIGMARLCKPFGTCESRIIALWKDARRGPFEIELPYDASGVVLCLHADPVEQWTADGRSDEKTAASWVLNAVHPVALNSV